MGCCNDNFLNIMLDLIHKVWQEEGVPKGWADVVLVPIPKKGVLGKRDNWRGVALLEVVGKVVAKVLQERLQQLAEEELPESQCRFRRDRGCSDMIYTVRQLVEKSWEHRSKAFLLFIDLKKAYDSVPCEAMWIALGKLGVPQPVINLIQSFHQNMQAQIQLNGTLLEEIDVTNGLRQGCCMAPALFNLNMQLAHGHNYDTCKCPCARCMFLLHPVPTCADGCWCPVPLNLRWWCFPSSHAMVQILNLHSCNLCGGYSASCNIHH